MKNTIVLLGMSGVGKSYHSSRLGRLGYKVFHIDDQIAKALGEGDVRDIALWLGPPYEERYKENSKKYLELENRFTKEALEYALQNGEERIAIDTTGSLVYLENETLKKLIGMEHTVLLDSSEEIVTKMIKIYLNEPKPVIWGDMADLFTKDGYLKEVERFYPELLRKRRELYHLYAKKIVAFEVHKSSDWSVSRLLEHY